MGWVVQVVVMVVSMAVSGVVSERIWNSRREMVEMAGYGEQKLSSVLLTGSLLCQPSSHHPSRTFPLPGATIGVKCKTGVRRRSRWIKGVTDEAGEFVIDLPSELHAIPDLGKTCLVKPLHVPKPYSCSQNMHTARMALASASNGFRIYTAGNIRLHSTSPKRSKMITRSTH